MEISPDTLFFLKYLFIELNDSAISQFDPIYHDNISFKQEYYSFQNQFLYIEINNKAICEIKLLDEAANDDLLGIEYAMIPIRESNSELEILYDRRMFTNSINESNISIDCDGKYMFCLAIDLTFTLNIRSYIEYISRDYPFIYKTKIRLLKQQIIKKISNEFLEFSRRSNHDVHLKYYFNRDKMQKSHYHLPTRNRRLYIGNDKLPISIEAFLFLPKVETFEGR